MENKPLLASKTIWFNFISGVLLVLEANQGVAKHFFGDEVSVVFAAIVIAGNAFLRVLTTKALTVTGK